MARKIEKTPVLFRVFRDERAQVIAIFPTLPGSYDPSTCLSYMHVGQHGACDPAGLLRRTRPAQPGEYLSLYRELTSEPYRYKLQVVARMTRAHVRARLKET